MILPEEFIKQTKALLGEEEYKKFEAALEAEPSVSIRINEHKLPTSDKTNAATRIETETVPWCATGEYLKERLTFTFDPLFHAGGYYVQEASSMFIEQIIRRYVHTPVTALDLCAAPGGKSTHLRSLLPEGSILIANEVIRNRAQVLGENLIKWGHPDVIVTNNDPADFSNLTGMFDIILTDVPCSGEGMFRKDETAIREWSTENVALCSRRQRRIVADIWDCLKPGGILIYSTCTYNEWENEQNIRWLTREYKAEPLPVDIQPTWGITGNLLEGESFPVYRFLPHRTKGEGLFMAALQKPESDAEASGKFKKNANSGKRSEKATPIPSIAFTWLHQPENFVFETNGNIVTAFTRAHKEIFEAARKTLRILHSGVTVGEIKGKDLIPSHVLAMSYALQSDAFPQHEADYVQAIAYLRKEAITLPEHTPRGYVLLTYKNIPLGFVKNLGNRANNLYPNEWRIRSGFLPEDIKILC